MGGGPGGAATLRVARVAPRMEAEQIRPDVRNKIVPETELRPDGRVEFTLPSRQRVEFSLRIASQVTQDARATIGGSGLKTSRVLASSSGAVWLVPTIWNVTADWYSWTVSNLRNLARRLGLSTRMLGIIMMVGILLLGLGTAFYIQYQNTVTAREEALEAQEALAAAEAAQQAAILSELSCLEERQTLIEQLGDVQARLALQAEQALAVSSARTAARELGGSRMGSDAVLAFDEEQREDLENRVVSQMSQVDNLPSAADLARCLAQADVLAGDLPRYALVWHPDPEVICPTNYSATLNGVALRGRWGLSDRVVAQYGGTSPIGAKDLDPRLDDRWSAQTLSAGISAVQTTLLGTDIVDRPPVLPSQSQLWSLALWTAYARMPMTPDGVLDRSARECVEEMILDVKTVAGQSAPGEPLLPDLVAVAEGDEVVLATPTPGCPWPPAAIQEGARAALTAVAALALVDEVNTEN